MNIVNLNKGWTWVELQNISEIILGQSPPSTTYNRVKKGLPFYQGKLEFGEVYPSPRVWCSSPKKIAEKGDILISVRAPVGPTNICPEKSCIGRGLAAIRPLGGIDSFFILYLLRNYEDTIAGKSTGTTFGAITGDKLRTFEIPLPPLNEQKRIVSKLEELLTKLDAGIEYLKKNQILLKQYRQSVLKQAFEGKLTEKWRKQNDKKYRNISLAHNNNNIFNNNYFLFEKNTIPENWNWYSLSDIARIGQGGTPSTTKKEYWNGKILWVRSGEVNWNRIISSSSTISAIGLNNSAAKLLPKDTVLLAMTGEGLTRGRSAILDIECATNQSVAFIIPEKHILLSKFLFYYFRKEYWNIREIKKGSNQPGLNTSLIKNFLIPIPSIDEQGQIILEIEKYLSVIENSEKNIFSSMIQSKILRDSILKNAFEGKLVPQDPNDESAEILLERIKRERESAIPIKKEKSKITKKKSIDNDGKQMRLM